MTKFNLLIAPATFVLLSACMGGGGDAPMIYGEDITITKSGGAGSGGLTTTEFSELADAFDSLSTALEANTYTAPATRPTGSVAMTGYIGANEPGDPDSITLGNLSVTANFDTDAVSGTASDFQTYDTSGATPVVTETLSGTLTITGSNVGNGLTANVVGDLNPASEPVTLNFDVDITGDLYDIEGTPTYVGTVSGGGFTVDGAGPVNTIEGDFVAF